MNAAQKVCRDLSEKAGKKAEIYVEAGQLEAAGSYVIAAGQFEAAGLIIDALNYLSSQLSGLSDQLTGIEEGIGELVAYEKGKD